MTDPATPGPPEPTAPAGRRPWPAPSPNSEWWRGEGEPAAERTSPLDGDTQPIRTDRFRPAAPERPLPAPERPLPEAASEERRSAAVPPRQDEGTGTAAPRRGGRHAAPPTGPTVRYTRPAPKPAEPPAPAPSAPAPSAPAPQGQPVLPQAQPGRQAQSAPHAQPAPAAPALPKRPDPRDAEPRTFEFTLPIRATREPEDPPTAQLPEPVRPKPAATPVEPPTAQLPEPVRPKPAATPVEPPTAELPEPVRPKPAATPVEPPTAELPEPVRPKPTATPVEPPTAELPEPVRPRPTPTTPPTVRPATPAPTGGEPAAPRPPAVAAPTAVTSAVAAPAAVTPAVAAPAAPARDTDSKRRADGNGSKRRADDAGASAGDGFPLWPDVDDPTLPIAVKRKESPEAGTAWQAAEIRMMRGGRKTTAKRPVQAPPKRVMKKSRPPAVGLTALVLLSLLAGFFGWVSADPFWLAIGHAQRGTATVTQCAGSGLQARCVGTFAGASFSRDKVAVSALTKAEQRPGVKVQAQMVSAQGRIAYAGRAASLHLRWIVGIALVLLCGLGIAWATGTARLETRRARLAGFAMSVAGPLLIAAGTFAVTW